MFRQEAMRRLVEAKGQDEVIRLALDYPEELQKYLEEMIMNFCEVGLGVVVGYMDGKPNAAEILSRKQIRLERGIQLAAEHLARIKNQAVFLEDWMDAAEAELEKPDV